MWKEITDAEQIKELNYAGALYWKTPLREDWQLCPDPRLYRHPVVYSKGTVLQLFQYVTNVLRGTVQYAILLEE